MSDSNEASTPQGAGSRLEWLRRHFFLTVIAVLVVGFVLYQYSRVFFAYTSDAYVQTDIVTVAPVVAGLVAELRVKENQAVEKGDVLFVLDLEPFQYEVDLQKASLELAKQAHERFQDLVAEAQDDFTSADAVLKDAQSTHKRVQDLVTQRYATQQRLDDVTSTLNTAVAQHNRARTGVTVARDKLEEAAAEVGSAQARLDLAEYDLRRATVTAPESGHVAPFDTRVGDYLDVGQPVLAIVTDNDWRIVANMPEQHLKYIEVGQRTWFQMSSRPWEVYVGKVKSVSRGISRSPTESLALPYIAPTTEWIRLSRRFPVEIDVEGLDERVELFKGADARVLILH